MAGDRLFFWSTLPEEELQRRVQLELKRTDLSFAESQLLDAALERLRGRRGPSLRTPREMKVKGDDTEDLVETGQPEIIEEKKPKRTRKSKAKAEPEVAAEEVERSDFHTGLNGGTDTPVAPDKETKVARTASKVRKGAKAKRDVAGKVAKTKKVATGKARERIDPDAKVTMVKGAVNPFRPKSAVYDRVELVWKHSGKTVDQMKKLDILDSTIANMRKAGLIKVG